MVEVVKMMTFNQNQRFLRQQQLNRVESEQERLHFRVGGHFFHVKSSGSVSVLLWGGDCLTQDPDHFFYSSINRAASSYFDLATMG
jgi:hypothetical protein